MAATVHLWLGNVERTFAQEFVEPRDVVKAIVRQQPDDQDDLVGPEAPAVVTDARPHFFVVWLTAAGTPVVGGAGRLRALSPDTVIAVEGEPLPNDLQHMTFSVRGADGFGCTPGPKKIPGVLNNAELTFNYEQQCP